MKKNQSGFSAIEAIILVVVVALAGFVGWYVWQNHQKEGDSSATNSSSKSSVNTLDYVAYDNNLGQKYRIKFYKDYELVKSPVSDNTSTPSESSQNGVGLGSKVSKNGKTPIWLGVGSRNLSELDQTGLAQLENGKKCMMNGGSNFFSVHNTYINQDINVCYLSSADKNPKAACLALFTYKDKLTAITIVANKGKDANGYVATTDFATYESDLKTIISSLEVVSE